MLADRMANGRVGVRSLRYKQSFQDGKQRFLSNARLLAAPRRTRAHQVLRCWKQHGTAYLAMPLYEGRTLNDVLRDSPKPSGSLAQDNAWPFARCAGNAPQVRLPPCNVTPDNIVVAPGRHAPALRFRRRSFGRSEYHWGRGSRNSTRDLRRSNSTADDPTMVEGPWTDIYSVAAVLHFAITGKRLPAPAARMASDTLAFARRAHRATRPRSWTLWIALWH